MGRSDTVKFGVTVEVALLSRSYSCWDGLFSFADYAKNVFNW